MQLINCKITYTLGENLIYTTEVNCADYRISIENENENLKGIIQTSKSLTDFKIEFFVKIPELYDTYHTNGYQTWSTANTLSENKENCKFLCGISKAIAKGSGFDFASEYNVPYDENNSYGYCFFTNKDNDKTLIFTSLDESECFTKYNYDFTRHTLKITRDFKGYTITKTQQLADIVNVEANFNSAFTIIKSYLGAKDTASTKLVCYNTFLEYKNKINERLIKDKIHDMQNNCDVFLIGDGYSECGYDLFCLDKKRFPNNFKCIVDDIHAKGILAGIWIAPFAISPLSKNYNSIQNLLLKQNEKPIVTCPFWEGTFSLDITNDESVKYLESVFDLICNEYNFDVIFCDCMYMAASLPTDNKTQAMLMSKAIELVRKFTNGKTLILGGVPFLSAVTKCDYISISSESLKVWNNPFDILLPEFTSSTKCNLKNLICKSHQNLIYPCIYSIPNCEAIKPKLFDKITKQTDGIILAHL